MDAEVKLRSSSESWDRIGGYFQATSLQRLSTAANSAVSPALIELDGCLRVSVVS